MSENSYVTGLFYIINSFDKTRLCKNFFLGLEIRTTYMASYKIVGGLLNSDNFFHEFTFKDNDFSSLR